MENQKELLVGVSNFSPFVIEDNGRYSGFEIELWEKIAQEIGTTFSYKLLKFQDLLLTVKNGKIDVAMAGLTMTTERETFVDFSHTTFNSGLHILVPNKTRISLFALIKSMFSREIRNLVSILVFFVLVASHAIWFVERNGTGTLSGPYWPGVFNAMWWVLETVSTVGYGDYTPVTVIGRIAGMLIILSGLAIFGLYIGQISSTITLKRLHSDISSTDDLKHRKVATVIDSVSQTILKKFNADIVPVQVIDEAYTELIKGNVDAVVFDAPVILDYANNAGKGKVTIVGGLFERQNYGFALQENSPLREKINRAILKFYDNGEYAILYKKWFGESF